MINEFHKVLVTMKAKWVLFVFAGVFSCGALLMNVEGTYYYAAWGTSPDSTGCINYDSNSDSVSDASIKTTLELAASTMTLTRTGYSDTDCNTLDYTIVATSDYSVGADTSTYIIQQDLTTSEYSLWSAEPVTAVAMDLTYVKAELTCETASCVTLFTVSINAAGCSTGTLSANTAYDYTDCQFSGQPQPLYSVAYKNNFDELIFGHEYAFDTDPVSRYNGKTTDTRYKYLLINEKFLLLN